MKSTFVGVAAAVAAVLAVAVPIDAARAQERAVSIVLVHGAFVDASGWRPVYDLLSQKGYEVLVVQNPTITLDGDAAIVRQAIAQAKHPVVLVGHSYGGAVITEAGVVPKVKSLVYLAAFAPDAGESVLQLASTPVPDAAPAPLLPPKDGFIQVDPAKFSAAFAADVDPATSAFMAASQIPWGLGAVGGKLSVAAWKTKPSFYLLATRDRMIPPAAQRVMAARANAEIVELRSSHAVMLSEPGRVAEFIEMAAERSQ
jgi:pimeloyl-ACP methyl ester carboxylesterase